jgi:mannose-6-phosphate isomerase-like protein (cupin superfamily)
MSRDRAAVLESTYVHLGESGAATPIPVTERFWPDLTSGQLPELEQGRLVTQFSFDGEWDSWEMHPEGDELGVLLSGSVDLILDQGGQERTVELRAPGAFAVIPRGAWHRARALASSAMVFVTAGRGTRHRPFTR